MKKTVTLVLGGSFNPVHQSGHIGSVSHVYHTLNLAGAKVDEAWLMPAAQNPFKPKAGMAPYAHRLHMCQLEAEKLPWLEASNFESRIEAPHYTHRVLSQMLQAYPDRQFIWMMGSDNLDHFHEWEYWKEMVAMVPMVIMAREGSIEHIMHTQTMTTFADCLKGTSAPFTGGHDIRLMVTNCFAGAATHVRNAVKAGLPTPHLSPEVRAYVDAHELYL